MQLKEGLERALSIHAKIFNPTFLLDVTPHQKIESSLFPLCSIPSFPWLQTTYWKKVSLIHFRKILPKMLLVVHILTVLLSQLIWKSSLELNPLIQSSFQQNYLPELFPLYLTKNVFHRSVLLVVPTRYELSFPFLQTFEGNPVNGGRIPTSSKKINHFLHQKNLPQQIASFMWSPNTSSIYTYSHCCCIIFLSSGFM